MNVQQTNNQNFTGIHIQNIKCLTRDNKPIRFKVFELTSQDNSFLKTMYDKVELEKLTTGIESDKLEIWYTMLKEAINLAKNNENKAYLLSKGKNPCGIITFNPNDKKFEVLRAATWPLKKNEKVPLAGTVLFKKIFEDFLASKANLIELTAIKNGPYDVISKYIKLGFKPLGGGNFSEFMRTTRDKVCQTAEKLNSIITQTKSNNCENLNLFNELSI